MSNEQIIQLRKLVTGQLQTILDLYGKEIQGTDLELQIRVAMASIGGTEAAKTEGEQKSWRDQLTEFLGSEEEAPERDMENAPATDEWDEDENEPAPVPQGFADEESYMNFLRQQAAVLPTEMTVDEETGEERLDVVRPDDTVGVIAKEDGTYETVGNMEESITKATEMLQEMHTHEDEYTGDTFQEEIPAVNEIRVKFYAPRVNELTEAQVVTNILGHPVSRPMVDYFGDDYHVENGERDNEKVLVFAINQADKASHELAQGLVHGNGLIAFGGRQVIPGLGAVTSSLVL